MKALLCCECGRESDTPLCEPCWDRHHAPLDQRTLRAVRDELGKARVRSLREVEGGYDWDPVLFWDDTMVLFEKGGRFEIAEEGEPSTNTE